MTFYLISYFYFSESHKYLTDNINEKGLNERLNTILKKLNKNLSTTSMFITRVKKKKNLFFTLKTGDTFVRAGFSLLWHVHPHVEIRQLLSF